MKQVLRTQMINPKKKDWIYTVKENMKHLDIKLTFENIQLMSKDSYKKLIKNKIKEGAFKYLISKRNKRNGKGMEIEYTQLEMQNYLRTEDIEITNFKIKTHFRNMHENTLCDGCHLQESTIQHTLECKSLIEGNEVITYLPNHQDLYGNNEEEQVYVARIIQDNLRRLPAS